ncbi:MAG TPA: hypothetical protein VJL27_01480 [Patescibacteria group bacterium]|nr:hypothetical protein [Patescibacteria group bacterium]
MRLINAGIFKTVWFKIVLAVVVVGLGTVVFVFYRQGKFSASADVNRGMVLPYNLTKAAVNKSSNNNKLYSQDKWNGSKLWIANAIAYPSSSSVMITEKCWTFTSPLSTSANGVGWLFRYSLVKNDNTVLSGYTLDGNQCANYRYGRDAATRSSTVSIRFETWSNITATFKQIKVERFWQPKGLAVPTTPKDTQYINLPRYNTTSNTSSAPSGNTPASPSSASSGFEISTANLIVKVGKTSDAVTVTSNSSSFNVTSSDSGIAEIVNKTAFSYNRSDESYEGSFQVKGKKDSGATVTVKSGDQTKTINVSVQGNDED